MVRPNAGVDERANDQRGVPNDGDAGLNPIAVTVFDAEAIDRIQASRHRRVVLVVA